MSEELSSQENLASPRVERTKTFLNGQEGRIVCTACIMRTLSFYRRLSRRGLRVSIKDKEDTPPDWSVLDRNLEGLMGEYAFRKRNSDEVLEVHSFLIPEDIEKPEPESKIDRRNRKAVYEDQYDAVLSDGISRVDVKTTSYDNKKKLIFTGCQEKVFVDKDFEFVMFARTDQIKPSAYVFYAVDEKQNLYTGLKHWCRDGFRRCVLNEHDQKNTTVQEVFDALDSSVILKMNPYCLEGTLWMVEAGWCSASVPKPKSGSSSSVSRRRFTCFMSSLKPLTTLEHNVIDDNELSDSLSSLNIDD